MYSETRPWGTFFILDEGTGFKVKRIAVNPGGRLSLQSHKHRLENHTGSLVEIIEVQFGDYLGEDDIIRYDDVYNRT